MLLGESGMAVACLNNQLLVTNHQSPLLVTALGFKSLVTYDL